MPGAVSENYPLSIPKDPHSYEIISAFKHLNSRILGKRYLVRLDLKLSRAIIYLLWIATVAALSCVKGSQKQKGLVLTICEDIALTVALLIVFQKLKPLHSVVPFQSTQLIPCQYSHQVLVLIFVDFQT
jgi:hypothetical protein